LKPIGDDVYEREYNRYVEFINQAVGETYQSPTLKRNLPIYYLIFEYTEKPIYKEKGRYKEHVYDDITITSMREGWQTSLDRFVAEYVRTLKFSIVKAMIMTFSYIKLPLKSIERINIQLGKKGFEGAYRFNFEDGSSFVLNTQGIGAGGYNIQVYHYRYITDKSDITLPDGTKTKDLSHFR
jgi:hypothetical protein